MHITPYNQPFLSIRESARLSNLNLSEAQLVHIEGIVRERLARSERTHEKRMAKLAQTLKADLAQIANAGAARHPQGVPAAQAPIPLVQRQEVSKQRELDKHWDGYQD